MSDCQEGSFPEEWGKGGTRGREDKEDKGDKGDREDKEDKEDKGDREDKEDRGDNRNTLYYALCPMPHSLLPTDKLRFYKFPVLETLLVQRLLINPVMDNDR